MRRPSNEDAFCALTGADAPPGADAFIAVADGIGGHQAGEVASAMAIEKLVQRLSQRRKSTAGLAASRDGYPLAQEVQRVNVDMYGAAQEPGLRGMGTTLTAAVLAGSTLHLAHVGDSRAYRLRTGELRQLTRDHSWVAEQAAAGLLTPEEARGHPRRSMLTRALGTEPTVELDEATIRVRGQDILLLCSDGLHSLATDEEIARVLAEQEPQAACEALVKQANARGGDDNITAVVLRIDRLPGGKAPTGHGTRGAGGSSSRRGGSGRTSPGARSPLGWVVAGLLRVMGRGKS